MNSGQELPEGFGRRATDRIPAAALLEKAAEIIGQKPKTTEGETMPAALAKEKQAALKKAQKEKGITAPKHESQFRPDPKDPFGVAAKAAGKPVDEATGRVVESVHGNDAGTGESNMTAETTTKTKAELDAERVQAAMAAKQAKIDAKAKADADRAEKKAQAEKEKAAAKEKREADAQARREAKDAERAAQLSGTNRTYTGSMLALAEKVKAGAYVKGAHGQLRSNDELAQALDFVPPANVVKLGMLVLGEPTNKYASLNVGQQSMNYRNRLRGAIKSGLKVGEQVVTLDFIKEIRDRENLTVEPTPKKAPVVKTAETAAPATEGEAPAAAEKPKKGKKAPAPAVTDAGANVGLPA
jgi:hypothetical protein